MFSGFNFSSFEETFKSYLLNYYDPDQKLRGGAPATAEMNVETKDSLALTSVHAKNYALTFFRSTKIFGDMFYKTKVADCLSNSRYVHRHELDHDFVHPEEWGDQDHTHVIKQPLDIITTQELECILNDIHRYQKEVNICDKNNNECYNWFDIHGGDLLNKKDHEKIVSEYRKFLKQESKNVDSVRLHYNVDQAYKKVVELGTNGFTSFITAFVSTLFDHYVEKGLLSRGATPKAAALITSLIKSIFIFPSIPNSLITTANHVAISNMLKEIGLNPQGVNLFMNNLNAVISVTSTPFSLMDMALNGASAAMGQALAYKIIGCQPSSQAEAVTVSRSVIEAERTVHIDAYKPDVSGPRKRR